MHKSEFMRYWNKTIETMPRSELRRLQRKKLLYTLEYAYSHSPFYHSLFDEMKVKPSDFKKIDDLMKLPIITKKDIIQNQPPQSDSFRFFSASREQRFTQHYTSGTKGVPKIFSLTRDDWDISRETTARAYTMEGIGEGDLVLNCFPFGINVSGLISMEGFRATKTDVIPAGIMPFPPKIDLIKLHKPTTILGIPSYIDRLSRELEKGGMNPKNSGLNKIVVAAEPSTQARRDKLAETFNAQVFDLYASTEGKAIASECIAHKGLHIVGEDYLIVEVANPETKDRLSEGEVGIDLITTLVDPGRYIGSVLINYHHGDQFSIVSEEECECGRTLKRISHPTRADDAVIISGAKLDPSDIEAVVNRPEHLLYLTGEYEAFVDFDEKEKVNILTIRVDAKGKANVVPKEHSQKLKSDILAINYPLASETGSGGINLNLEIVDEGSLEVYRPGKPKRIIDRRKI